MSGVAQDSVKNYGIPTIELSRTGEIAGCHQSEGLAR
jgi:hypothetical protein